MKVTVPMFAQNRWRVAGLLDDIPLQPKIECANRRQRWITVAMLSGMRSESHPLRGSDRSTRTHGSADFVRETASISINRVSSAR